MSSNLMDIEPGGETTQYESIKTFTEPHAKQQGQLGGDSSGTQVANSVKDLKTPEEQQARGEQTAENIRYGQAISEEGMGGQTTGLGGAADEKTESTDADAKQSRQAQGYGSGSGVGA